MTGNRIYWTAAAGVVLTAVTLGIVITLFFLPKSTQGTDPPSEIRRLEEQAGFEILWPSVLPDGVDQAPATEFKAREQEAFIYYYPMNRFRKDVPLVVISQTNDPDERHCPPCPELNRPDLEEIDLGSMNGQARVSANGEGALLSVFFRRNGIRTLVLFDWRQTSDGSIDHPLPDELREEALALIRSMIRNR
jgi:hypothetical protein